MIRYLSRRLTAMVVTLLVASFIVYAALYLSPGDPLDLLITSSSATPELIAAVREQFGLDKPFFVSYIDWLMGVFRGDFGTSLRFRQDVGALIASRLPTSLLLIAMAGTLTVILGISLGVYSGLKPGRTDRTILNATSLLSSLPVFVTAFAFLFIFGVGLGWFPVSGGGDGFADQMYHLVLPSITLSLALCAIIVRITRASVKEQVGSEHVSVAQGRGISGYTLYGRHVFRNSLTPILTQCGIVVAGLLVSSQLVEVTFGLDGMGSLMIQSVQSGDFPVVQAITLIIVFAYVVTNLVIDLLLPVVDPRISLQGSAR